MILSATVFHVPLFTLSTDNQYTGELLIITAKAEHVQNFYYVCGCANEFHFLLFMVDYVNEIENGKKNFISSFNLY